MNSEQLAWLIRRHAVEMTHLSHGSHIGSVLSIADLIAVLYQDIAVHNPEKPKLPKRDRIILSKGHAGAAVYAALAEEGYFKREELKLHYADGSRLSGHVSHKGVPGIEFSTGSLGHGLSVAAGMAYAAKKDRKTHKVYVICGDGECEEGAVWEAALTAHQFQLNNLIAMIDCNKMQSLGFCEDILSLAPFAKKWSAFGWKVLEVNGHNHSDIREALIEAGKSNEQPVVIIADTIKGKGISFMEANLLWHYRYPHAGEEYDSAIQELLAQIPEGITDPYPRKSG